MKRVKKWLFPALTALIVAGAAVLPPGISQVRDARQFGQVHTEPLDASALPAYEPPGLLDRLALYAGQGSEEHPILSYNAPIYADDPRREEQMWAAWETLINGELVPGDFFDEEPYDYCIVSRTLLWDPAASDSWQEPSAFVGILAEFHAMDGAYYKNLQVRVDEESGLPVEVHILDTNMARWLPYHPDEAVGLAERYFALLGLDTAPGEWEQRVENGTTWLRVPIPESEVYYSIEHAGTVLSIRPQLNGSGGEVFDG